VKSLEAELRSILHRRLWLGCRDWNQKACAIAMLDLVADREDSATVNRSNDSERPAEQRVLRIAHYYFDNG
jgi:plasmid stability protein